MNRPVSVLVLVIFLLALFAAPAASAQTLWQSSGAPAITSFTTTVTVVDRAALAARTARVPVSWATANRPVIANLFFEQVLDDGSAINVELPRAIPWVASSGNGTAAPILPGQNATQIVLRVRLVNLVSGQVYGERQLTLPIGTADGGGSNSSRPAVNSFTTCCANVRADQLNARTARVPVSWATANRPPTSNLVFEQVLSDGSVVNVELPRDNPWVASSGDGVIAPVPPGGSATTIRARVRLVDLLNGRVYDVRELTLNINSEPVGQPRIRSFTTNVSSVDGASLSQRTARVPVAWAVDYRPDNSNLAFEQVLPNGAVTNVELPRPNPWVASEGSGVAAPLSPGAGVNEVVLRVRLFNLTTGFVYDQKQVTLSIINAPPPGDPRIRLFTSSAAGVDAVALAARTARVPVAWAVDNRPAGANLVFEQALPGGQVVNVELPRDNPWVASEGTGVTAPVLPAGANVIVLRLRLVNLGTGQNITTADVTLPITGTPPPAPSLRIDSFTASPQTIAPGGSITLAWSTTGAARVRLDLLGQESGQAVTTIAGELPASGTYTYAVPRQYTASVSVQIVAEGSGGTVANANVVVSVTCPYATLLTDRCPISQAQVSAAFQAFEHGWMAWRGDTRDIYVLHADGHYERFADTWADGEAIPHPQTPPAGLIQPERGFGKLWENNASVRSVLGWATGAEAGYQATLEAHPAPGWAQNIFMTLPDGRLLRLDPVGGWQFG